MNDSEKANSEKFNFELYKKNISSQNGEDGIIEEIFKRIKNISDYHCCEFGAWDGKYLSNTYNLIKNHNYNALLIEGDKKRFIELKNNFQTNKVIKLNKFVNFSGENTLDNILDNNNFKKNFDFLSIDIDGNDYHIFESMSKFTPKIACIEFNPTIPNDVSFIQKRDMNINQGCSGKSLIDLALKKNYFPIASTITNLFFAHNSIKQIITKESSFNIDKLIPPTNKNYIFCGYDGTVFTSQKYILNWHLEVKKISILPFFLIKHRGNYNIFQKFFFKVYKFFINPMGYLKKLKKKLVLLGIF